MVMLNLEVPDEIFEKVKFLTETKQIKLSITEFLEGCLQESAEEDLEADCYFFGGLGVSNEPLTDFELFKLRIEVMHEWGLEHFEDALKDYLKMANCELRYMVENATIPVDWIEDMPGIRTFVADNYDGLAVNSNYIKIPMQFYNNDVLRKHFMSLVKEGRASQKFYDCIFPS